MHLANGLHTQLDVLPQIAEVLIHKISNARTQNGD